MARSREIVHYVYICSVCEILHTAPTELNVCPACVWFSLFVERTAVDDHASDPIYCEADGCDSTTRHRKPYCSDHVELMPYVVRLLRRSHS